MQKGNAVHPEPVKYIIVIYREEKFQKYGYALVPVTFKRHQTLNIRTGVDYHKVNTLAGFHAGRIRHKHANTSLARSGTSCISVPKHTKMTSTGPQSHHYEKKK